MRFAGSITGFLMLACMACSKDPPSEPPEQIEDWDDDTISDAHEGRWAARGPIDIDGDTVPDFQDTDSENDSILDWVEAGDQDVETAPVDSDSDGLEDFRDTDSDDNGMPDGVEGTMDMDGDTIRDHADPDNDGDEIDDVTELQGAPSTPVDTDGDTIPDFNDFDSDNDTLADRHEGIEDTDEDGTLDRHDLDSDDDTIPDSVEAGDTDISTPPVDTDGDGVPDCLDLDSDADGLSDACELEIGTDPYNRDSDMDGTSDNLELLVCTDPLDRDSHIPATGPYAFVVPYLDEPEPSSTTIIFPWRAGGYSVEAVVDDDTSDEVDATQFIDRVVPNTVGGVRDPLDRTWECPTGLSATDTDGDTLPDELDAVPSSWPACFDMYPSRNESVAPTDEPQQYDALLSLKVAGITEVRDVYVHFIIPASTCVPFRCPD